MQAASCRLAQPAAAVLAVDERGVWLNGFHQLKLPTGGWAALPEQEQEGLRQQLESRLLEHQSKPDAGEQLILAADHRVKGRTLTGLLRLAASRGVSRVCLKVSRRDTFVVPCCLPLALEPRVAEPLPVFLLQPDGLHLRERAGAKGRRLSPAQLQSWVKDAVAKQNHATLLPQGDYTVGTLVQAASAYFDVGALPVWVAIWPSAPTGQGPTLNPARRGHLQ